MSKGSLKSSPEHVETLDSAWVGRDKVKASFDQLGSPTSSRFGGEPCLPRLQMGNAITPAGYAS